MGVRHELGHNVVIYPARLKHGFLEPLSDGVEGLGDLDPHIIRLPEEPCRCHVLDGEARQAGEQA